MNYQCSPLFIVSSERSGSNLLRNRITESQSLYLGASPAHFLKHMFYQEPYFGDLHEDRNFESFLQLALDLCKCHFSPWQVDWSVDSLREGFPVDVDRNSIQIMHYLMNKYSKENGYQGYICKDNYLYEFAKDIACQIPQAKFIYLYRDPRDCVLSEISRPGRSRQIIRFSKLWCYEQTKAIKLACDLGKTGRCMMLSYEKFINNESEILKGVLSFMAVNEGVKGSYMDGLIEYSHDWKNINKVTDSGNFHNYKVGLSHKEISLVEMICFQQMSYLGYSVDEKNKSNLVGVVDILRESIINTVFKFFNGINKSTSIRSKRGEKVKSYSVSYRCDN